VRGCTEQHFAAHKKSEHGTVISYNNEICGIRLNFLFLNTRCHWFPHLYFFFGRPGSLYHSDICVCIYIYIYTHIHTHTYSSAYFSVLFVFVTVRTQFFRSSSVSLIILETFNLIQTSVFFMLWSCNRAYPVEVVETSFVLSRI
jgi:hypothetical protein